MLTNDNTESRRVVEQCYRRHKTNINPIIEWSDTDVWNFINAERISYCELYHEGFSRIGCIGCPMASHKTRELEFIKWPKYKDAYLRAFEKMIQERNKRKLTAQSWERPVDVFNWWMEYDVLPGQFNLFEDYEEEEET